MPAVPCGTQIVNRLPASTPRLEDQSTTYKAGRRSDPTPNNSHKLGEMSNIQVPMVEARWGKAGSSRLIVWPVLGDIQRPAFGSAAFSIRLVSRHAASSSPTMSRTGVVIVANLSRRLCSDGRRAWQRLIVSLP